MKIFRLLFIVIILNQVLFSDVFRQKKGKSFLKLTLNFTNAEEFYDTGGENIPLNGTFTDINTNIYGKYILNENILFFLSFTVYRYTEFETNPGPEYNLDYVSGIGDALLGIRTSVLNFKKTKVSTGFIFNLPFGKSTPDGGLLTGTGDFYQGISFLAEHQFLPVPGYLNAEFIFVNRTEGYSDQLKYNFEAGYFLYTNVTVALHITGVQPLYNGSNDKKGGLGIFLNDQKFLSAGGEIMYVMTDYLGLSVSYSNPVFGKNFISSPVYAFGIYIMN